MASVAMLLQRSRPSEAPRILAPRPSEAPLAPPGPPRPLSRPSPMADSVADAPGALAGQPQDDQGLPQPPPPEGPQQEEPLWHLGWDDLPLTSLGILKAIGDPRFEFLEHNYRAQLVDLQKREINKTPKKLRN